MDNTLDPLLRPRLTERAAGLSPAALAVDEKFWQSVATQFARPADFAGLTPTETVTRLMSEHRIFVNEIRGSRAHAVRATVGLATLPADVDRLAEALARLSGGT